MHTRWRAIYCGTSTTRRTWCRRQCSERFGTSRACVRKTLGRRADMTCADCLERLGSFVDGELPADETALIEEHLRTCDDCARAHRRLVDTSSQVKAALMRYQAPDVLKARIRASLADPAG